MNLPKHVELEGSDQEIRGLLKHWSKQQVPPPHAKGRLLRATVSPKNSIRISTPFQIPSYSNELMSWAMVYSFNRGVATFHLVR
jgi:hypothetical protein